MQFLRQSVSDRARRIELEDALLMVVRCVTAGAIALALARPFLPLGSRIPWAVVLPLLILAMVAVAIASACWSNKRRRWFGLIGVAVLFGIAGAAVVFERSWNLQRLGGRSGGVALLIDASTSMAGTLQFVFGG